MNYEDIQNYDTRCNTHPDHPDGILTFIEMVDRLHDEIAELRTYIESHIQTR